MSLWVSVGQAVPTRYKCLVRLVEHYPADIADACQATGESDPNHVRHEWLKAPPLQKDRMKVSLKRNALLRLGRVKI